MPKWDLVDEAIIEAGSGKVFRALLDEAAGATSWWMPHWESKLRGDTPIDHEGAVFDITIRRRATLRFSGKITKIVEGKLVELEFGGDFVGTGAWMFEPIDGKTKVQYRWNVKPKRLSFVLLSPFMDIGKIHSDVIQKGFKELSNYLSQK